MQPRPQGFSPKKWVGREKALASAGHVSSLINIHMNGNVWIPVVNYSLILKFLERWVFENFLEIIRIFVINESLEGEC